MAKLQQMIGEDWYKLFEIFLTSNYFTKIQKGIAEEMKKDLTTVVPSIDLIFKPFELCRLANLKVVILNDKPFQDLKANDGLAFSIKEGADIPREGDAFFEGIEDEMHEGLRIEKISNTRYLAEQGVLLLNACPSFSLNNHGWFEHRELWQPFTNYVITTLAKNSTGIVYILCGKDVRNYAKIILPTANYLLTTTHPRDARHFAQTWDSGGIFEITNMILKQNNNQEINW